MYATREEAKEARRGTYRRYKCSSKGEAVNRRYDESPKGKARHRRCRSSASKRAKTPEGRAANVRRVLAIRAKKVKWVQQQKGSPCLDCGKRYGYWVMHFHHVRGEKEFSLSRCGSVSYERIKAEIAKCDLLCANCHAQRHHNQEVTEKVCGLIA